MLNTDSIQKRMRQLDDWQLEATKRISKSFQFNNFNDALEFTNKVGNLAEAMNHHPDIFLSYGKVSIQLQTHEAGNLIEKDFDLAEQIDQIER